MLYWLFKNQSKLTHFQDAIKLHRLILQNFNGSNEKYRHLNGSTTMARTFEKMDHATYLFGVISNSDIKEIYSDEDMLNLIFDNIESVEIIENAFNNLLKIKDFDSAKNFMLRYQTNLVTICKEIITLAAEGIDLLTFALNNTWKKTVRSKDYLCNFFKVNNDVKSLDNFLTQLSEKDHPFFHLLLAHVSEFYHDYLNSEQAISILQLIPEDSIWYDERNNLLSILKVRELVSKDHKTDEEWQLMFKLTAEFIDEQEVADIFQVFTHTAIDREKVLLYHHPKANNYGLEKILIKKLCELPKTELDYFHLFQFIAKAINDSEVAAIYRELLKSSIPEDQNNAIRYRYLNAQMQTCYDQYCGIIPSLAQSRFNFYYTTSSPAQDLSKTAIQEDVNCNSGYQSRGH